MAKTPYNPPDPKDVRDCNECRHADWDRDTEWGRCVERRTKLRPPESGIYILHRRMTFDECLQFDKRAAE